MATTPLREALALAENEINAGRPGEALRQCDLLLGTHPRWLDAQRLKAKALVALDRLAEAEQLLDGILACNPEDVDAFCDRAYLMQRRGEPVGALACYRRACELARDNSQLRAMHNQMARQLGRAPYTPSHTGLARLYLRSELFAHAAREWDVALSANPNRLDAQIGMAETQWRMGAHARAQEICRFILRHMANCIKPLLLLVYYELEAGHQEEAQRLTQLVAEMDPEQRVAGELFGDLVAAGNTALAQLFRTAVRSQTTPLLRSGDSQTGIFPAIPAAPRPGTTPLPNGQLPTGPLFKPKTPPPPPDLAPTSKLTMPGATNGSNGSGRGTIEDYFSQSRAAMLPEDFGIVFRETEYMLWSRDNDEPNTAEIPAVNGTSAQQEAAPVEDDTDSRFVRWLQEQGARPLGADEAAEPTPVAPDEPIQVGLPPFLAQALATANDAPAVPQEAEAPSPAPAAETSSPAIPLPSTMPQDESVPASPETAADIAAPEPEPAPPPKPRKGTWTDITPDFAPKSGQPDIAEQGTVNLPVAPAGNNERAAAVPAVEENTEISLPAETTPQPDTAAMEQPATAAFAAPMGYERAEPAEPEPPATRDDEAPGAAAFGTASAEAVPPAPEASVAPHDSSPAAESAPPAETSTPTENMAAEATGNEEPAPLTIEAIQQGLESAGFARLDTGRLASVASSLDRAPDDSAAPALDVDHHLTLARDLRRQGRMGEALVEYRALVKASSDRMPEIIRDLRDAAIEDPREAEIHRLLGDAYIRQGDYVEALEAYNRASALRHEVG